MSNDRQRRALELLRAQSRRMLYETAHSTPTNRGHWAITYTGDEPPYEGLTHNDVLSMRDRGLIVLLYEGAYVLATLDEPAKKGSQP